VPRELLKDVSLHVDGNGAPEFGDHGLNRILIPSGGQAEIQFTPLHAGRYDYRCDLPGHEMIGYIAVEEPKRLP
jgi:hypothetical protein